MKCFSHAIQLSRCAEFVLLLLVAYLGAGVWNASADEVILTNADRISGRLISLSPQTVRIATSHSGTMEMDRKHLQQLQTDHPMVVKLVSGERLIGRISAAGEKDIVIHSTALGDCPLSLMAVESIAVYRPDENINKKALHDGSQEVFKVVGSDQWRLLNKEKDSLAAQVPDLRGKGMGALKASDETAEKSTKAAKPLKPIGQRPEDEDDIRRIFLRQSSVLLKADEKEFEMGFNYLGNQVSATVYNASFRQFQLPLSFRIGLFERLEGFVSIPLIQAEQEISFTGDSVTESTTGIGDTSLGINYEMYRETAQWPDITTALTIRAPTGDEPDETGLSTGSGHWAGSFGLQFIKTADPVVLFWGVRYTHEFEATHFLNDGVYDVQPGETVDYNFGFGFAVNDKVSLSNQVLGGYQWETKADGREISGSASEPVSFRSALTYRVSRKNYLEPSVTIGLNDDRPDFVIGICATRRFGN